MNEGPKGILGQREVEGVLRRVPGEKGAVGSSGCAPREERPRLRPPDCFGMMAWQRSLRHRDTELPACWVLQVQGGSVQCSTLVCWARTLTSCL